MKKIIITLLASIALIFGASGCKQDLVKEGAPADGNFFDLSEDHEVVDGSYAVESDSTADGHPFDGLQVPDEGYAMLYMMRQNHTHRLSESPTVMLNGRPVITIGNAGYSYIQLDPGTYAVTTDDAYWAEQISISLETNNIYFMTLEVVDTAGHDKLGPIAAAMGVGLVGGLITSALVGDPVTASREWVLNSKADALFNMQHYRYVPLLDTDARRPN